MMVLAILLVGRLHGFAVAASYSRGHLTSIIPPLPAPRSPHLMMATTRPGKRAAAATGTRRRRGAGQGSAGTALPAQQLRHAPLPEGCCPSCGQKLGKSRARHMAFCCPDLLDPDGWGAGDRDTVLRHAQRSLQRGSAQEQLITRRFGARGDAPTQQALCASMSLSPRRVRDTIASFLHSIPPPAEHKPLSILYEDRHMVVVNKPAGLPVTPSHRLRTGSVLNRLVAHLGPRAKVPAPVHRLDLNTSGVLIFAKSSYSATALMQQFERRSVRKAYAALCVVESPAAQEGANPDGIGTTHIVDAPICRVSDSGSCVRRTCGELEPGAQTAQTALRVVAVRGELPPGVASDCPGISSACLVLAAPRQGRTHQVRLHCCAFGVPLIGDDLYGHLAPALMGRHGLHALSLRCVHPASGDTLDLFAPLPEDMSDALLALRLEVPSGLRELAEAVSHRAVNESPLLHE